jgi:hypothetical protein
MQVARKGERGGGGGGPAAPLTCEAPSARVRGSPPGRTAPGRRGMERTAGGDEEMEWGSGVLPFRGRRDEARARLVA